MRVRRKGASGELRSPCYGLGALQNPTPNMHARRPEHVNFCCLWWVIDPILSMAVFYLVFSVMLQSGTEGFVAFLLSGLVIWNWYRQSISNAGGAILTGQGLMGQVHVPKLVFPATTLLTDLTKFALVFVLLLVFLWLSGYPVGMASFRLAGPAAGAVPADCGLRLSPCGFGALPAGPAFSGG